MVVTASLGANVNGLARLEVTMSKCLAVVAEGLFDVQLPAAAAGDARRLSGEDQHPRGAAQMLASLLFETGNRRSQRRDRRE